MIASFTLWPSSQTQTEAGPSWSTWTTSCGGCKQTQPGQAFSFWIAPATLIFEDAWSFEAEVSEYSEIHLALDRIQRSEPDQFGRRWWTLDGHQFTARLLAPGFTQVLRNEPIASHRQSLSIEERGGHNFSKDPYV